MAKLFSPDFLRKLRNDIPVDYLIVHLLKIPYKFSKGFFRFLCPHCSDYDTATNRKTNLARCFRCQKNYNPIDLVMISKGASFLNAVKFLKLILALLREKEINNNLIN